MSNPFLSLLRFFESKRWLFILLLSLSIGVSIFSFLNLKLKEDIAAFIPKNEKSKNILSAQENLKLQEKIIVHIFHKDSLVNDPDALTYAADLLVDSLNRRFDSSWVKEIKYKVNEEEGAEIFDLLYEELPYYLEDADYADIANKISDSAVSEKIKANYNTLRSPEGMAYKNFLIKDPLGLNKYALEKLSRLQTDESIELYNGYFITTDRKHLFIYLTLGYPKEEAKKNEAFVNNLASTVSTMDTAVSSVIQVDYFGGPVIAVSNVTQIKKDSILTTSIALFFIFVGLYLYFRSIRTVLFIFIPVLIGAGFSISLIYFIKDEISAIAIGAGSIVLGIAIDYSLHYFTHLKQEKSVYKVISDLTLPLTLGCVTTVGAFLCLHFMQSEALQDMGLFAGFTLLGAALSCLVVLPQLTKFGERETVKEYSSKTFASITNYAFHKNKVLLFLVVVLTLFLSFFFNDVAFETDMTKLSYITPELKKTEDKLDELTNYKLKSVFVISEGKTLSEAINKSSSAVPAINKLVTAGKVKKYSNVHQFLLSDSIRKVKLEAWNAFWNKGRVDSLENRLYKYGAENKFRAEAFAPTLNLVKKEFNPLQQENAETIKDLFLKQYLNEEASKAAVITILKVKEEDKSFVYEAFEALPDVVIFDKGSMATMFAQILKEDFNLILILSSIIVFSFLLLSYGRIELALLTFLPMVISWVWILGIMGLFGVKFNIVNIIICTFIFGLGDDYSIFTVDGLEQKYKYGKGLLSTYRSSIFLSAYTTMLGVGVLLLAKHPALQSIALITVIGIFCIVAVSLIVQPFLYEVLVLNRKENGKLPFTLYNLCTIIAVLLYSSIIVLPSLVFGKPKLKGLASLILWSERHFGDDFIFDFTKNKVKKISSKALALLEEEYARQRQLIPITDYYKGRLNKNYIFKGPVVEWYAKVKISLEGNYKAFESLIPKQGSVVDVGCGYGHLSYMLNLTAPDRVITGVDYDEEKISIAQNAVLKNENLTFVASDVMIYDYKPSDCFVISDVLHYLSEVKQKQLIENCIENLNPNGVLIIRDGNSEMEERHKGTKLTELFSTKIIRFNKVTEEGLFFTSKNKLLKIIEPYNLKVEIIDDTQFTSNITFVIRK